MYRAFVSSTFDDMLEHRMEAIRTLQAAGIQVDPMESWQADPSAPGEFSVNRMAGCDLFILLVAFRRGTVPPGRDRSIVQMEYDEARRRGIDVLPFLLRDDVSPERDGWPASFDDRRRDPAVDAWRAELRRSHGLGDFGPDPKSLRIEAALARWVVQRTAARSRRWRRAGMAAALALLATTAVGVAWAAQVYSTPELRSRMHGRFLEFHDPVVFNSADKGSYQIARTLASRTALIGNTKFTRELSSTEKSLDMLVDNAQYIRTSQIQTFRELIRKGVRLRIILLDYTTEGDTFEAFHRATDISVSGTREGSREMRRYLMRLRDDIARDPGQFRGTLEFRWNPRPLLYTMWIRDWHAGGHANALGHLSVAFYRGEEHWPVFRTSSRDNLELLDNMHAEFEMAWATSTTEVRNPRLQ